MPQLPHQLKRIRLQLARSKEFPTGSWQHGYEFVAPLDANGQIDPDLWHKHREHCRARRFWQGEDDRIGRLVCKPGGKDHGRWIFDYDPKRVDDDEVGYRLSAHAFRPGEYVTMREADGEEHTFKVVSVEPAT